MHWLRTGAAAAIVAAILGFPGSRRGVEPAVRSRPVVPAATTAGGFREQELETEVPERPAPPRVHVQVTKPPPKECVGITMAPNGNRKVRTVADEDLPAWVPVCGRLTVVESSDMAENLGLVPPGTTKANPDRIISVAEELEREAREHPPPPKPGWTYVAGETFVDAR